MRRAPLATADDQSRKSVRLGLVPLLLIANMVIISLWGVAFLSKLSSAPSLHTAGEISLGSHVPVDYLQQKHMQRRGKSSSPIGFHDSNGTYFVSPREGEQNFYAIGVKKWTDKVLAPLEIVITKPSCTRSECRPWGHRYHTIYQQFLGPYSKDDIEAFQFLEIGFYKGSGYDLYREFFPKGECHSMEIACIEPGPRSEGKWPYGNFPSENKNYQKYLNDSLLHCGDASEVKFLNSVWKNKMNRTDSPPLKIVVDDGAHLSKHMAQTMFFWFPRIEPRGMLIVEDIQPTTESNSFRSQFLPQIMKDLHYCGDPNQLNDDVCFPTLLPLLASIHCEMHICIFERNDNPARELSIEESTMPANALDISKCKSDILGHW